MNKIKNNIISELNFIDDRMEVLYELAGKYSTNKDNTAILFVYKLVENRLNNILKQMNKIKNKITQ